MAFFSPQFFFISLLTFYLQTLRRKNIGDIVFFYLSFCRNAIKTVDPLSHGHPSLTCTPLEVGFLQNLPHQTGNSLVGLFAKDEPNDQTLDDQLLYALGFFTKA